MEVNVAMSVDAVMPARYAVNALAFPLGQIAVTMEATATKATTAITTLALAVVTFVALIILARRKSVPTE